MNNINNIASDAMNQKIITRSNSDPLDQSVNFIADHKGLIAIIAALTVVVILGAILLVFLWEKKKKNALAEETTEANAEANANANAHAEVNNAVVITTTSEAIDQTTATATATAIAINSSPVAEVDEASDKMLDQDDINFINESILRNTKRSLLTISRNKFSILGTAWFIGTTDVEVNGKKESIGKNLKVIKNDVSNQAIAAFQQMATNKGNIEVEIEFSNEEIRLMVDFCKENNKNVSANIEVTVAPLSTDAIVKT